MKLRELDWTPGRKYKDIDGDIWQVDSRGRDLVNAGDASITEYVSLKNLATTDFEPYIDWSKVEVDTKVLVSDGVVWHRGHFAKFEGDRVYTYSAGRTSWTRKGVDLIPWKYTKLAESGNVDV